MSPEEVLHTLQNAQKAGCIEALFCLGDTPETVFPEYRRLLQEFGFEDTVDYLHWACEQALSLGLLPHTNAGILSLKDLAVLRPVNVSMGLMLESVSERLCKRGMPHHRAPDKRPKTRIKMIRDAGALKIPFTTGILIGIGETRDERIESLECIAALHREFGHIQEVIIQNFRQHPHTPMALYPNAPREEFLETIALARLLLPPTVSIQAPPNLTPKDTDDLFAWGVNDLGGISPLTPDYINPGHPWPHLAKLAKRCEQKGHRLRTRLPVYPDFINRSDFISDSISPCIEAANQNLHSSSPLWETPPQTSSTVPLSP